MRYNNSATLLASSLKGQRQRYGDVLKERIFKPLGMDPRAS